MFNRDYLEKLKQYVGKDIQLVESDNEVHIYLDSEIQYFLRKKEQKYILYVSERGKETEEKRYCTGKLEKWWIEGNKMKTLGKIAI